MAAKKKVTTPPPDQYLKRIRLKTAGDIYEAMAKLTRMSAQGKISIERYRSLIYGLNLLMNALKVMRSEGSEEGSGELPLGYFYGFPDESQKILFDFYSAYWWIPHYKDYPREQGEAWHPYLNRLKEKVGHISDSEHIEGLKFNPITRADEIEQLFKLSGSNDVEPEPEGL